jgi:hypothetical protein
MALQDSMCPGFVLLRRIKVSVENHPCAHEWGLTKVVVATREASPNISTRLDSSDDMSARRLTTPEADTAGRIRRRFRTPVLATPWDGLGTLRRLTYMLISGELLAEPATLPLEDPATFAAKISTEPLTTRARPPDPPTWVADHEAVGRDIFGHDGTGSNEGMLPDGHATDNNNPGAQSSPLLHGGRQQLRAVAFDVCSRAQVIGKCDARTQKYIVAYMHALEDHDLVLDRDAVPDRCAVLHKSSIANVAVTADARAR